MNGHESVTMPIDGLHGPVITAVTVSPFRGKKIGEIGNFFLEGSNLGGILRQILTKLGIMNGHESVTMPVDGLHGPVITAVTVG